MSEIINPHPGNLVRLNGVIFRIGCGATDEDCSKFERSKAMEIALDGETRGRCELVQVRKGDPPVKVVDVLEDRVFDGQPVTVFCGEKKS